VEAWKIYHNPKCGTSRKVLAFLKEKGIEPEIVEYLKTPPAPSELDAILRLAGLEPGEIVRKKEPLYGELGLDGKNPSRAEWLKILSENPVLIERPIVVRGKKAALLARPAERVETLL
jgi:arsenate reductase